MINNNDSTVYLLKDNVTSGESSDVLSNSMFHTSAIQVIGAAPVGLYVSNDGTNFAKYGVDLGANSWTRLDGLYPFLKVTRDATTTSVTVLVVRQPRPVDF